MRKMNHLAAILTVLVLALGLPAEAGNRKGDKLLAEGRKAEARGEYDTALEFYERALAADPSDAAYLLHVRRARFVAAQRHVDLGQKLRREGKLEEALVEFRKAFTMDPSSTIAEQELRRTNQMIEREKKQKEKPGQAAAGEERGLTEAEIARREAQLRAARMLEMPELKPATRRISGLKIVNQTARVMYETIGKLAGINVLFDPDFQQDSRRFTLDLNHLTLDEALNYVSLVTKTYYKPLSSNTIFVTQDNATKRRDYEEHITRVFYLQNVYNNQELTEVMTAMRTVTDVRKVFPVNSQYAIVMRGTADQLALAEKVLLDLDRAKPEVVVDVLVMEANRTRTRDLALTPLSAGKPGLGSPVTFTGGTSGAVPLNQIKDLGSGDWSVVLPSFLVQALLSDRQTRVLTSPQVRAVDGQKATLRLGDRYPYATGSFASTLAVGGAGMSPLVQTQFQFADVGVNIDLTPRVHGEEISLQVELEISNIRERIDVGGLSQPVIGQRRVAHLIRAREGEVTLIGGLMQANVSRTRSGVPGLMNIPVLGRLFSSENLENANSDLLVALIPRVVRSPEIPADGYRGVASGADQIYRVRFAREPEEEQKAPPARQPGEPVRTPLVPGTAAPVKPQTAPPAAAPATQPAKETPAVPPAVPPAAPPAEEPAAAQGPRLLLQPSAREAQLNSTFTVRLQVENVSELFSTPLRIRYDQQVLRLLDVQRGPFLSGDGAQVTFSDSRDEAAGLVIVNMNRVPGSGGITGSGVLLNLKFQAVARGDATIKLEDATLRDARLEAITTASPSVAIRIP